MKKRNKIKNNVLILFIIVILIVSSCLITLFLQINGKFSFLNPVYRVFYPNTEFDSYIPNQDNLGLYNDAISRDPELKVRNDNLEEFSIWQSEAQTKLKEILGIVNDGKFDSEINFISKKNIGDGVERYLINFTSYDNVQIPCYLFLHEDGKKRPGIVVISGHGKGIVETANIIQSDQNGNAEYLAKNGYVTVTCENRGFGLLGRINYNYIQANAIALGRSYQGVILDDHMQAVSLLQSIKQVDDNKIGAAGVSLGGEQVMYLAALDPRIKASVIMGWLSGYEILLHKHSTNWAIPSLLRYFDQEAIGSLIVPRPVHYSNGEDEEGPGWFNSEDALITLKEIRTSYGLFGKKDDVEYVEHKGGHSFDNKNALEFFDRHLKS